MTDILYNGKKIREMRFRTEGKLPVVELILRDFLSVELPLFPIYWNAKPANIRFVTDPKALKSESHDKPHIEIVESGQLAYSWDALKIPLDYEACDKTATFDEDRGYYKRICKLVRGHQGACDWSTRIEVEKQP